MKALKLTDNELYELGIEVLTTTLGPVGVFRFMIINMRAPITGDYSVERHQWLDKIDMEDVLKEIKEMQEEEAKQTTRYRKSNNGKSLALCVPEMTDTELYQAGLEALVDKLTIAGMPRFIRLCAQQTGIYAIDPQKLSDLDIEGIIQEATQDKRLKNEI